MHAKAKTRDVGKAAQRKAKARQHSARVNATATAKGNASVRGNVTATNVNGLNFGIFPGIDHGTLAHV